MINARQRRLRNMIETGWVPRVVDATRIWHPDPGRIPFHWGDLEVLGYGYTIRLLGAGDEGTVTRHYTGPGISILTPGNQPLRRGSSSDN